MFVYQQGQGNRGETGSLKTARPATQSCRCSHFGIARGSPPISSLDSGDFSGHGHGAGEVSRAWGEVAAGVRVITLAQQAQDHYSRALQARRDGDWAAYGKEITQLGEVLEQLQGADRQN